MPIRKCSCFTVLWHIMYEDSSWKMELIIVWTKTNLFLMHLPGTFWCFFPQWTWWSYRCQDKWSSSVLKYWWSLEPSCALFCFHVWGLWPPPCSSIRATFHTSSKQIRRRSVRKLHDFLLGGSDGCCTSWAMLPEMTTAETTTTKSTVLLHPARGGNHVLVLCIQAVYTPTC